MKQLALDLAGPAPCTLDNFVAGRNGELLHALRRLVAGDASDRFLYVWGVHGSGRTHLLQGVVSAVRTRGSAACVACAPGVRLDEGLWRMDCVALDDVERLDGEGQIQAFDLYNTLRERGGALLAAGAEPPVQLALRQDLVTRLAWGLVYRVEALTDEEKAKALAEHAAARGFALDPGVSHYLLSRASRDLASLLGIVDALDRYSLETRRPVTVPLVRELLHAAQPARGA